MDYISYFHKSLMKASETIPLSPCSPTALPFRAEVTALSCFTAVRHKHSEYYKQPPSTTSYASNSNNVPMLTAEMSIYSFKSLLLWRTASNSAWNSIDVLAQITLSKQLHAYATGLLGPNLHSTSAFYMKLIHVSTSHFLPPSPPCLS